MRIPIALGIFLVHVVFTVAVGAIAYVLVFEKFEEYRVQWERRIATVPAQNLIEPLGSEIGRALLLKDEQVPEAREKLSQDITAGLQAILREIPSISDLYVVDTENRVRYTNREKDFDLVLRMPWFRLASESVATTRIPLPQADGTERTAVVIPIFERPSDDGVSRRRLGTLFAVFREDPDLVARLPVLSLPTISPWKHVRELSVFVGAVVGVGLLIALLTSLPVRRLDRAVRKFSDEGFRGKLDADKLGLGSGFEGTVRAINEMGGRLAALDARGREREALLATLGERLEQGMVALDARGHPVAWNDAAVRLLVGESTGVSVEIALREALDRHPDLTGPASDRISVREVDLPARGGLPGAIRVTEVPFELRPGEAGTLLLLRDLATEWTVGSHVLDAQRFDVLVTLAGSLAHEIRNPLHSIGLNASVVEQCVDRAPTPSNQQAVAESLQAIQSETRRLTDLLNNYLGMLRSSPEPTSVDVRDLCRRVMALVAHEAMQSKVTIQLAGEENIPRVSGVPDRLQQALLNLVLNAIQAMPKGGAVSIRTAISGGAVRVAVSDTGPGLPPDLKDRLFETRFTTKDRGTGLGLPIVRLIAEEHGGSVDYTSDPGRGTTFTMVLPADRKAA